MIGSGWTLEQILDLTWDQLEICIRCVVRVKAEQAQFALEAISTMLGGKPKKGKKSTQQDRLSKPKKKDKEDAFLSSIAQAGFSITDTGQEQT